ncbi:MAG: hypothetical protein Q8L78_06920 [Coxiellaceae bacterium]|nr:hypothetical protein [Coxiellaceae bacterium]
MNAQLQFQLLDDQWSLFPNISHYYFKLGAYRVCLSFADTTLPEKIVRAFDHLKIDAIDTPDLTICLWDVTETACKLPNLNWALICSYGYAGYLERGVYFHYFEEIMALSVLSNAKNKAFYIVRDSQQLPWWVSGSPLQVILHLWLSARDLKLTHTAAIGNERAAVLLTGKGGSGKSTTVLSCMRAGLSYLGEDYCILECDNYPTVYSIYQSAKWESNTRKLFPDYESHIKNPLEAITEKALVYYQDFFSAQIKLAMPISGIIALSVGDAEAPFLKKQERHLALKNLMMSTVKQLPLAHHNTIPILMNIVSKTACYELILGKDVDKNVALIRSLL